MKTNLFDSDRPNNSRTLDLQPWTHARFMKYYNWIELICQADPKRAKELSELYRTRFYKRNITIRNVKTMPASRYCCESLMCDLFDIYSLFGRSYRQATRSFFSRLYWIGQRWLNL